jgi:hypothetical protein
MERSALFIAFFWLFLKFQQSVHKAAFYSGPPFVLNSPELMGFDFAETSCVLTWEGAFSLAEQSAASVISRERDI